MTFCCTLPALEAFYPPLKRLKLTRCETRRYRIAIAAGFLLTFAFPKFTVPGPLTFDHVVLNVPLGKPSSVAVPLRLTDDVGNVIV